MLSVQFLVFVYKSCVMRGYMCDDLVTIPLVFPFLRAREKLLCAGLSRRTRSWALNPQQELTHLLECLDLTFGCWRGTQYYEQNPLCLNEQRVFDSMDSYKPQIKKQNSVSPHLPSHTLDLKLPINKDCPNPSSWLLLRAALDLELLENQQNQDVITVGGFQWQRRKDYELEKMSYRLKHFWRGWLQGPSDLIYDEYHINACVYFPIKPLYLLDNEQLAVKSPAVSNRNRLLQNPEPFNVYDFDEYENVDISVCAFEHVSPSLLQPSFASRLRRSRTARRYGYFAHALVPFIIRVLLHQPKLVTRLCDIADVEITPASFLRSVQEAADLKIPVFGYNVEELLLRHSAVFALDPTSFWELGRQLDNDPETSRSDLMMTAQRAFCSHESFRLAEIIDYVAKEYPQLGPFISPGFSGLTKFTFAREGCSGAWTLFLVGREAGLLYTDKHVDPDYVRHGNMDLRALNPYWNSDDDWNQDAVYYT
eukprot:Protomagalhaensia_wolfi_Nauph_80__4217@NODE_429_length_2537_cov_380_777422_g322_i0_p1_GENE_NODE_429_length_2537_cov_380_777422_g322_i0NODE_429_length_2537_cov_380_777422_g322_i0_p1_ORF_typecomplete_len480_score48_60_NODE_429_length_2537_cov_380_777422_g322_i01721611